MGEAKDTCRISEWNRFLDKSASPSIKRLVASSWAPKTQQSYNTALKKWDRFCTLKQWDTSSINFDKGLQFLVWLYEEEGATHGVVAASRSVRSAIAPEQYGTTFGKDPLVSKVVKGMFKERPQLRRKLVVYDTDIVIKYMAVLPNNEHLLLEPLTKKLATLLCILSEQRSQSIAYLFPKFMHKTSTTFTFYIPKILKTTTPNFHQDPLEFEAFCEDQKVCVHSCLTEYLDRTSAIRENLEEDTSLILSYAYPYRPVKSATLARYVKEFLGQCGIDLTVFTAHSTRSASTSKANNMGLSLKQISKAAGWRGTGTFQRFYKFPIRKNFGTEIVKAAYRA